MNKKYIIGLGNPEDKYSGTRHNIGFEILDRFRTKYSEKYTFICNKSTKLKSIIHNAHEVALIYPQTYMNLSGEAIIALINYYKIDIKNVLIVYDDTSLDLGQIRWKNNGGAGGHHGIESVIQYLHTKNFNRIKFGVGPDPGGYNRANFVLQKFTSDQLELCNTIINKTLSSIEEYLQDVSIQSLMNTYNTKNIATL